MTVQIQHKVKQKQNVRVKILRAPFVDSGILRKVIIARSRAIVL